MKKLALGCLLLSYLGAFSQANESGMRVFGVVIDSVYQLPISDVHISTKRYGTVSAENGIFSLLLSSGDSLYFTHVSYKPFVFVYYAGIHNHLKIALIPKIRILKEVKVLPFDTEEAFKTKLLEGDAAASQEVAAAKENSAKLKGLGAYAPLAPITNFDRFNDMLAGPKGFTFFSSSPSQGIIKLIKGQKDHDASYRPPRNKNSTPAKFNTFKPDTLKVDNVKRDSVRDKKVKPKT